MANILLGIAVAMLASLPAAVGFSVINDALRWPKSPLMIFVGSTLVVVGAALIANIVPRIF